MVRKSRKSKRKSRKMKKFGTAPSNMRPRDMVREGLRTNNLDMITTGLANSDEETRGVLIAFFIPGTFHGHVLSGNVSGVQFLVNNGLINVTQNSINMALQHTDNEEMINYLNSLI